MLSQNASRRNSITKTSRHSYAVGGGFKKQGQTKTQHSIVALKKNKIQNNIFFIEVNKELPEVYFPRNQPLQNTLNTKPIQELKNNFVKILKKKKNNGLSILEIQPAINPKTPTINTSFIFSDDSDTLNTPRNKNKAEIPEAKNWLQMLRKSVTSKLNNPQLTRVKSPLAQLTKIQSPQSTKLLENRISLIKNNNVNEQQKNIETLQIQQLQNTNNNNKQSQSPQYYDRKIIQSARPKLLLQQNKNTHSGIQSKLLKLPLDEPRVNQKKQTNFRPTTSSVTRLHTKEYKTLENYDLGIVLGQGSYAIVRLAIDKKNHQQVAIKTYLKSKLRETHRKNNVKREIEILRQLNHPNIITLYQVIDSQKELHLVTSYGGSLSLRQYLKSLPGNRVQEEEGKRIFKQIVRALDYCHSLGIVHRDMKLENILLDNHNNIKLIDFGFSIIVSESTKLTVFCGTPSYMAPEIVQKQDYYGKPVDIWSLGVILYVLLNGSYPFKGQTDKDLFNCIQRGQVQFFSQLSNQAEKIILSMLKTKPCDRATIKQIINDVWLIDNQLL